MNPLARSLPLIATLVIAAPAIAGLNAGTVVTASWSPTMQVWQADCAPVNTVYLSYKRTGGLTFQGADLELDWTFGLPAPIHHDPTEVSGCITYLQTILPRSGTCSALNRGTTTLFENISDGQVGHALINWINSTLTTGCDSGLVAEIQIESDPCSDCGFGLFLPYAKVYDGLAWDECAPNVWLELGHGPFIDVRPTTWGGIKELMRR